MHKLKKLPPAVLSLLNERLKDEYYAFYLYRAASNWSKNVGFDIAAKFFAKESEEELEHAKKIEDFIVLWNSTPMLPSIEDIDTEFKGLYELIEMAYSTESDLYEKYEDASVAILEKGDVCAFDFLQFFRTVQTESVGMYADMLNKIEGVNTSSKFEMLSIEEKIFA